MGFAKYCYRDKLILDAYSKLTCNQFWILGYFSSFNFASFRRFFLNPSRFRFTRYLNANAFFRLFPDLKDYVSGSVFLSFVNKNLEDLLISRKNFSNVLNKSFIFDLSFFLDEEVSARFEVYLYGVVLYQSYYIDSFLLFKLQRFCLLGSLSLILVLYRFFFSKYLSSFFFSFFFLFKFKKKEER